MSTMERVRRAQLAGYVAAIAGAAALVAFALFSAYRQPFGTLNDLLLLVMTASIAPIMLGCYELATRSSFRSGPTCSRASCRRGTAGHEKGLGHVARGQLLLRWVQIETVSTSSVATSTATSSPFWAIALASSMA